MSDTKSTVAKLLVKCLEAEGVEYVFGIPGEENIRLIDAMADSSIRFILVRHEQGASFMADIYGRLTGKAGVCTATLGPGAINLLLGVADAQTDSTPMVAISAQVGLNRIYKESHQYIDLQAMFAPVTKWSDTILTPASVPEMMRKAFDLAQRERPGAVYLAVPQDLEESDVAADVKPITVHPVHKTAPDADQVAAAIDMIKKAKQPIILAGHGVARSHASKQLIALSELLNVPVATTFMAKGVIPDRHPNALGVAGFMRRDYENFAFDAADVILSVGYELQEFAPSKINPAHDKKIVHIHHFAEDIDAAYPVDIAIEADIDKSLEALIDGLKKTTFPKFDNHAKIKQIKKEELDGNADNQSFPLKPQRIISDIRKAMGDDDIVLADTGAIKMWMARLYPTQKPSTCLISNGLSTMAFALPGALAAKLACPEQKVLAVMGDGSFLMNSQEIETATRENIPLVVLIWVDDAYGLIKWKMDLEIKHHRDVDFTNPDFVQYAESFGAKGYEIKSADMLLPVIEKALADDGVSIIACPVDYAENNKLTDKLGDLTITI